MHRSIMRVLVAVAGSIVLSSFGVTAASASGAVPRALAVSSAAPLHVSAPGAQPRVRRYLGAGNTDTHARPVAARRTASSPDPTGIWQSPIVVTQDAAEEAGDVAYITAISCGAPGDCSAVGHYSGTLQIGGSYSDEGFTVDETAGSWGTAQLVTTDDLDAYRFTAISCPSAGNCAAVGTYTGDSGSGFVMDETDGTWGSPQVVSASLSSVSCPTVGDCTAAGTQEVPQTLSTGETQAAVVAETDGTWGSPQALSGSLNTDAGLTAISCPSAGNCATGGYYDAQPYGPLPGEGYVLVANEIDGTWGSAQTVTGSFTTNGDIDVDEVTSVSCSSAGNCSAGGYDGTYDGTTHAFVVSETGNSWSTATDVATSLGVEGAQISSISCPADGDCSAGGFYADSEDDLQALAVSQSDGTWQPAEEVAGSLNVDGYAQIYSVSCVSAGNCSAGGYYANQAGGFVGLVVTETDGTWGSGEAVATSSISDALAQVNSISCPSVGNCAAGGEIDDADDLGVAFVVDEKPIAAPTLTVSWPAKITYGSAYKVPVKVSGPGASPTGTVTLTSGSTTLGTVTLSGGAGTISVAAAEAKKLPPGDRPFAVTYSGDTDLSGVTESKTVDVVKASSKTHVALSATKVARTGRVKATVTVTASGVTPTGTVKVYDGSKEIASGSLKSGKITIRLPKITTLGTNKIKAVYTGSSDVNTSTSVTVDLEVVK